MEIKLNEQEVQGLLKYIGNIPTVYGADLMQFLNSKIAELKVEQEQLEEKPEIKEEK